MYYVSSFGLSFLVKSFDLSFPAMKVACVTTGFFEWVYFVLMCNYYFFWSKNLAAKLALFTNFVAFRRHLAHTHAVTASCNNTVQAYIRSLSNSDVQRPSKSWGRGGESGPPSFVRIELLHNHNLIVTSNFIFFTSAL